ncbi:MBOAT family protein [Oesophagostomum dentatum]|uniref:MBOAT family protein n=1 Tax=Oesophagostomum dentatum TaxID=61180 RepID=A0A0B1SYX1_OESDE|nr:MBOAT family protein [Oesophagostomum dentatum]
MVTTESPSPMFGTGIAVTELPSISEFLSYIFNFQTALTGPVNFYSDYIAFIDGVHVVRSKNGEEPSATGTSLRKLAESIFYLLIIAQFGTKYPPERIAEKEYLALPWPEWLLWWFTVIMFIRVNYYFAWTFADSVCNMSGFGFSGYDEHGNAKWELCTNVRPYQVEMAQSFKETLDGWNIQTGGWLRRVAYDRTPKKIRTLATYMLSALWHGISVGYYMTFFTGALFTLAGATVRLTGIRTLATYMLSALWHGISVGYYMTFFTGALFTLAGATFRRCMRHRFLDDPRKKMAYDFMTFMATKIALAYATYPFVTMNLNPAFMLYKRVYFIVHIFAILILVALPQIYPPLQKKPPAEANSTASLLHRAHIRDSDPRRTPPDLPTIAEETPSRGEFNSKIRNTITSRSEEGALAG